MKQSLVLLLLMMNFACVPIADGSRDLDQRMLALELIDQGTRHLRAGSLVRAEAAFKMSSELVGSAAAWDGLGCVAFRSGDKKAAEEYFWKAYQVDRNYVNALGNLALLYDLEGLETEASRLYKLALEQKPQNFQIRNNFAVFSYEYSNKGESSRARSKRELMKAAAVKKHFLIEDNLKTLEKR